MKILAVDAVSRRMRELMQQNTTSKPVLELTEEVTALFIEGSQSKYEGFTATEIDIDATAREEIYRRALAIEEHGIEELHKSYGLFTRVVYQKRMTEIKEATRDFVKIAKVIYEKNH